MMTDYFECKQQMEDLQKFAELESSPQGWMITSINQIVNNPISYHDYQIAPPIGPEAEVNIKVTDPQLIATLHHAMRGYC